MYTDVKIRYDDGDLIIAMLVDSRYSYFYKVCFMRKCDGYIRILGKDNIDKFRNIMVESGYIKYLKIVVIICDSNNSNSNMYLVRLNRLGNKERVNIENLFKLKGLLD